MSTDDKSISYYRDNAEGYAAHVRDPKDSVYHAYYEKPAMYVLLPDLHGKSVLSIGCGSGEDSHYLKEKGASRSVGIDLIPEMVAIAEKSYPDCEFRVMNMEKLDFPDQSFDFAYSSLAIHYVEDWSKVLKEVSRVLKAGSNFIFSCGHPFRFALENIESEDKSIYRLEFVKDMKTQERTFTGDYLAKRKFEDALGKNTANIWTMPISDISQAISEAGFLIEKIVEPRPLEELKEVDSGTFLRLSKMPEFIIFKLLKK